MNRVRGSGSIFRKGNNRTWTIQYYKDGPDGGRVRVREATGLTSQTAAQKILTRRLDAADRGELPTDTRRAVRVEELYRGLLEHNRINRKESFVGRWNHLGPVFGNAVASQVTTDDVRAYTRTRQDQGAKDATINRELATLRRMFNLGKQDTPPKVRTVPYIPMLKENNVRHGFVEDVQFQQLYAAADELWLKTFLELAYTYGWRRGELLGLRVRQVDLCTGTIRLDVGTTKNKEGREVEMTDRVKTLLAAAIAGKGPEAYVLTRGRANKPVKDLRIAWWKLCVKCGLGHWEGKKYRGLIVHDMRRSGAKALRRAGVPESVIMSMGGWKTPAMFRRYAIVSTADQRAAVEALERAREVNSPRSAPFEENVVTPSSERVQ